MAGSVFEYISHNICPVKAFVTNIESSAMHWHYDYEIIVVLKNKMQAFCGAGRYLLEAGDVLLHNSKEVHGYHANENNLCLIIQFSKSIFEASIDQKLMYRFYLNSKSQIYPTKTPYSKFAAIACELGYYSRNQSETSVYRLNASFMTLIANLIDSTVHDVYRSPETKGIETASEMAAKISEYIHTNCSEQSVLSDLYETMGTNEKSVYRVLKKVFGMTPKEMVDSARIDKSKNLLETGDRSILDIAESSGFISEATFYRVFKKELGITPKEYKKGKHLRPVGIDIQGYLSFDANEADALLKEYINKGC